MRLVLGLIPKSESKCPLLSLFIRFLPSSLSAAPRWLAGTHLGSDGARNPVGTAPASGESDPLRPAGGIAAAPGGLRRVASARHLQHGREHPLPLQGLDRDPQKRARVIQHELVYVVQDCLDGLSTPTSLALAEGLRSSVQLIAEQANRSLQCLPNQSLIQFTGYLSRLSTAYFLERTCQSVFDLKHLSYPSSTQLLLGKCSEASKNSL